MLAGAHDEQICVLGEKALPRVSLPCAARQGHAVVSWQGHGVFQFTVHEPGCGVGVVPGEAVTDDES